jgi:formylglycine-generating enzyme required for sulfatase activity
VGKVEVTQAQWRAVASLPKVSRDWDPDPSKFKGDNLPVEQVSWEDAMEFCARLSQATGRTYRLPSEAEWEYACRAGTTTPFAFGETITPELVNYDGNYPYASAAKGRYKQRTTPAGSIGYPNAFGLYDILGNVWEWCLDYWHGGYGGASTDGSAWQSFGDPSLRVLRGGSWLHAARVCRSAFRTEATPDIRDDSFGFRVVVGAVGARTP